ncbi:MAG: ribose-5-phosphate isomerase RpiA [Alphaproteobacteria bacterium]|nr:ribose-5-phosphate isomerase RpiA [Alphaproteobacteria bacterium]
MSQDDLKKAAAEAALVHVRDGMRLGLGTGSTARPFVDAVGRLVAEGLNVVCVPTSEATAEQARGLNIPLSTLDETPHLDVTVDGADELDSQLRLIKGGGGALLREKIVASASAEMVVIADSSKRVDMLGAFALPIEVVQFGAQVTAGKVVGILNELSLRPDVRQRQGASGPFITDGGNFIYDCHLEQLPNPEELALALQAQTGVVEHGLFIGLAARAYVASAEGVEELVA